MSAILSKPSAMSVATTFVGARSSDPTPALSRPDHQPLDHQQTIPHSKPFHCHQCCLLHTFHRIASSSSVPSIAAIHVSTVSHITKSKVFYTKFCGSKISRVIHASGFQNEIGGVLFWGSEGGIEADPTNDNFSSTFGIDVSSLEKVVERRRKESLNDSGLDC
mmetsp:Transcript_24346/g.51368  ORF Transcript_24346/g.51368 Transcript_24346/m.51368 type:complete len:163 (+) Transcript_24346:74-562(+)